MKNIKILKFFIILTLFLVPNNVKATDVSDEFKRLIIEEGKMYVKSIEPETIDEAGLLLGDYTVYEQSMGEFSIDMDSCNDDFTKCNIIDNNTNKNYTVDITYNYDKDIKKKVDEYVKKIGDKNYFSVRDMELVNFWINAKGDETLIKDYSSELKELFDFKNFVLDIRMGTPEKFLRATGGPGNIVYDGTIYHFGGHMDVEGRHILYVSEDTGNTKEELVNAIQKRIDNYIGKNIVDVTYDDTIENYYNGIIENYNERFNQAKEELEKEKLKPIEEQDVFKIMNLESDINSIPMNKQSFIDDWNDPNGSYSFLKQAEGDYYFKATIPSNEGSENEFYFIIVKDDTSMFEPIHITSDLKTNVTISSDNTNIPLDTLISASELTSGENYEKIISLLNLTDNITFDLKLYSNSLEKYITKLSNGTFEVKIPIPENFKEKNLEVYYIDELGNKETYTVNISDNYAVFNTNHFSIYTLGYKENPLYKVEFDANGGIFKEGTINTINEWNIGDEKSIEIPTKDGYKFLGFFTDKDNGTSLESYLSEAGINKDIIFYARWEKLNNDNIKIPETSDKIDKEILILSISILSIIVIKFCLKKKEV